MIVYLEYIMLLERNQIKIVIPFGIQFQLSFENDFFFSNGQCLFYLFIRFSARLERMNLIVFAFVFCSRLSSLRLS